MSKVFLNFSPFPGIFQILYEQRKPFSVVVLGKFRRFLLVIFLSLFLHLDFPYLQQIFNALWGFFIEKIFLICYNNSTL